ncbi:unnamed protein product [Eruca vesicaria subsp. sativa]|uniref:Macro domain-containing protein n=1 Tax=Eruca vesicaria subsp. sativa TaxID=29727 RepID=A0ABC8L4L8_ERUVS|nr:unnamed protein product [Eruca vesicaria subsp. sativa]
MFFGFLFRRVIHTVGPKYAVKYHTAAENALSHCYISCLELLIDNGLQRCVKKLLPLYFPRDEHEEEVAISKPPADVGDENGSTIIDEHKIRIQALPDKPPVRYFPALVERSATNLALVRRNSKHLDSYLDPTFMSLIKDPDVKRKEQWEKNAQSQSGFSFVKVLGFGDLRGPPLSPAEEYLLHSRGHSYKKNKMRITPNTATVQDLFAHKE